MRRVALITLLLSVFVIGLSSLSRYSEVKSEAQVKTSFTAGVGTPTLDGVAAPGEWLSDSITTSRGLTLKALIDEERLYILAQWADPTNSIGKDRWTFDGEAWSAAGDEDRVAIIWEMKDAAGNGLNGADGASCATMCHSPKMWTNTGRVDVWHWKANRTNPIGYVDDKYWDTCQDCDDGGRHGDTGGGSGDRNRNSARTGPLYMAPSDPGANVDFLAVSEAALLAFDPFGVAPGTVGLAQTIEESTVFSAGNEVPGRMLNIPTGNRASVRSAGKWAEGVWTVEFSRKLGGEVDVDGNPEDFSVVQGGSVKFTTETFDDMADHSQHPFLNGAADLTVYTLNFSQVSKLSFAQFADGGGLSSQITLYSLDDPGDAGSSTQKAGPLQDSGVVTNAKVVLLDQEGLPLTVDLNGVEVAGELEVEIPAGGMEVLKTDGVGDIVVGSVTVSADRELDGVVVFGGNVGLAGVGNSQALASGFTGPMEVNSAANTDTGVAVMNLAEESVTLDLALYDSSGLLVANAQIELPAKGQRALYVTEMEWDAQVDLSNFFGLLKVSSSGWVAATVIQTRPGQFATMPVSPN